VNSGGVGTDNFSVRWSGQVKALASGTYTFYTNSDDGVRLTVNGVSLVNNWTDHGPTEDTGSIALTAGKLYTLVMEFYENGGGATAQLSYSGPGISKQVIPQAVLYPDSAPIIVTQPVGQSVEAGTTASFTVAASGSGNTYQWRKNSVNIAGATSATLSISPTIVGDAGSYSCIVSNGSGFAISNAATLSVSFTDTDGDGIQNSWETAFGLDPNSAADANLDKDGDGESNLEEFLAGTNPNDPNDYLKPTITKVANGWKIEFTAQTRKRYVLLWKAALSDPTWASLQVIAEQPGVRPIEVTDTSVNSTRFYRVATPGP
jgi:hypothetical protein